MSVTFLALATAGGCFHHAEGPPPTYDSWPLSIYTQCASAAPPLAQGTQLFLEVKAGDQVLLRSWSSDGGDLLCRGAGRGFGVQMPDGAVGTPVLAACLQPPAGPLAVRVCIPGAGEQTWTMEAKRVSDGLAIASACGTASARTAFDPTPLVFSPGTGASAPCPAPGDLPPVHSPRCPCEREAP